MIKAENAILTFELQRPPHPIYQTPVTELPKVSNPSVLIYLPSLLLGRANRPMLPSSQKPKPMSPRSIRRAAERRQQKLLKKQNREGALAAAPSAESATDEIAADLDREFPELALPAPPKPVSELRLAANRANAQLSTGPTSPQGKSKSSLNAVKTALTGRTVLLSTDDAAAYEQHLRNYDKEFQPATPREYDLVQSIADTSWRLQRIPALELAIYAHGRIQFASQFDNHEPALRPGLIELHTFMAYEKQLRNLQLQDARLHRRREKDMAELRQLQQERNRRERQELEAAAKLYTAAKHNKKPFNPADFGFEFSTEDVEAYLEGVRAAQLLKTSLQTVPAAAGGHA